MSKALKCDRCGKLYELYSGIPLVDGGNRYHALTLIDQEYDGRHFDICPDCMQKLIYFLQTNSECAYNMFFQCTDCKHRMTTINDTPCVSCKRVNKGPEYDTDYFEYDEKREGE